MGCIELWRLPHREKALVKIPALVLSLWSWLSILVHAQVLQPSPTVQNCTETHPSICFPILLNPFRGQRVAGAYPSYTMFILGVPYV